MIQMGTMLTVADNSGAKKICCILPLGGGVGKIAQLGDVITASVKEAIPGGTVKKKAVVQAVIVRQRKAFRRKDGSLHPLRRERRRDHQEGRRTRGNPRVRPRGPRTPRTEVHEDRLPGP